jgi:subtilisin family serine protease
MHYFALSKFFNFKTKKMIPVLAAVLFLSLISLSQIKYSSGTEQNAEYSPSNIKKDYILVKYKDNDEVVFIELKDGEDPEEVLKRYKKDKNVEYAEPNFIYRSSIIPSDTHFEKQWYLKKINAVQAWDTIRESPEITIAILDSGVQIDHPDLRDNIWRNKKEIPNNGIDDDKNGYIDDVNGWDFTVNNNDPNPKFEDGYTPDGITHGTVVAGIAAASGNNAAGISGVTWKAKIMPLRVLNSKGEGDTRGVIRAIDYAVSQGADIINFSFVGFGYSQSMEAAIRRANEAGVIIVAAAGNEGNNGKEHDLDHNPMYPVCHDGAYGENMVVGVAATDALDQKAVFSGYGYKCVDISAPGISIFSTSVYQPDKKYADVPFSKYYDGYWAGTSMAVPMVSGAIALVKAANPSLSGNEVVNIIKESSRNIYQLNPDFLGQLGRGRLDVQAAVAEAIRRMDERRTKLLFTGSSLSDGKVMIADRKGVIIKEFSAFNEFFIGGIGLASGDIDGDGADEIVAAAGAGGIPQVKIFDREGNFKNGFLAYSEHFRGGVNIALGDLDGDGISEIITGAGPGGGPHIRIFDQDGNLKGQFFAYSENFRGGVNLASGDVDGDGIDEIVTGTGPGGGPQVRIFSKYGQVDGQFFAYDTNFRGGVNVAVADVENGSVAKKAEIITSPGKGGGPQIRIFDNHSRIMSQFFAYGHNMRNGVSIAGGDIDNDGSEEIITGAGAGGTPHVQIFKKNGTLLESFFAYDQKFEGGVNVGVVVLRE